DARIYVGGYDLGTVTLSLSIGRQVISVDSTVIVDPAERFVGGLTQDNITWDGIYDDATRAALRIFIGNENFEDRIDFDEGLIDKPVFKYLRNKFLIGLRIMQNGGQKARSPI
ncbi:hypothetical protein LCGC14_2358200, partial [marine sediment metagenome]